MVEYSKFGASAKHQHQQRRISAVSEADVDLTD